KFLERSLAEWMEFLSGIDVCFAPVNTLPEALADPNLRARAMLRSDEAGRLHIAPAIRFRDEPAQPVLREPLLGEHTAEALGLVRKKMLARVEPPIIDLHGRTPDGAACPYQFEWREQPPRIVALDDRLGEHIACHGGGVEAMAAEAAGEPESGCKLADLRHSV